MDAEDWRDHMPCPDNQLEKLLEEVNQLRLESGEMGDQNALLEMENDRLKLEIEWLNRCLMGRNDNTVIAHHDELYFDKVCSTCKIYNCPGAPRYKGICPEFTKDRLKH